jgi:hypothetical protein
MSELDQSLAHALIELNRLNIVEVFLLNLAILVNRYEDLIWLCHEIE